MPSAYKKYYLILLVFICQMDCKKPYAPPAIAGSNNYLVVDGVVDTGPNATTIINLNRTRSLGDTVITGIPELSAQVNIIGNDGSNYHLNDTAGYGIYTSAP